jgi:hypothetical protein
MDYNDAPLWPLLVIVIGFIAFWILLWCSIVWLISLTSGWQRLAQRYHNLRPTTGKMWRWQFGSINWAGYNGALMLTANSEGLFIETLWFMRFGHNRIFIPWHEFREVTVATFPFWRQVRAKIGSPAVATVRLPAVVFEESEGRRLLDNQHSV